MRVMLLVVAMMVVQGAHAGDWVDGYVRKDGTYVQGHYQASPDQYRWNNPSSRSMGGTERDEFSDPPRYNRSNPLYNPYLDQNGAYER